MAKARVLLVDDHAVVRMGVRALLQGEEDFEVVGESASGHQALLDARRLKPDIVLIDITLPDMNGLEAMVQIKADVPETHVVVLTMHEDRDYFFRSLQAGAAGYVVKGGGSDNILAALRAVQDGGVFLYPSLARSLVTEYLGEEEAPQVKSLSARELEVLRLIGDSLPNKEIASRLGVSMATAQTYRTRIMEKLGLHTVAELVRYAIRKGIIRP
ncbi:MAG: response regulator transcription factor [Chloroflexi bacterium]|nr:response regulator transcription factor [Chloroflexota bacterium]